VFSVGGILFSVTITRTDTITRTEAALDWITEVIQLILSSGLRCVEPLLFGLEDVGI